MAKSVTFELHYAKRLRPWTDAGRGLPSLPDVINGRSHAMVLLDSYTFDNDDTVTMMLEQLFLRFNQDGNPLTTAERQRALAELLDVPHTSMSIGDVIHLGSRYYYVDHFGFTELSDHQDPEELEEAPQMAAAIMSGGQILAQGRIDDGVEEETAPQWINDKAKAIAAAVDVLEEELYRLRHGEYARAPEVIFECNEIEALLPKLRPWIANLNYPSEEVAR